MTDNDKPADTGAAGGSAALPEDTDQRLPRGRRTTRQHDDVSDDVHAVARGGGATAGWMNRRREKIIAEVERNRRGDYKVPTWVLAVALVAILAVWAALIILS